MKRLQKVFWELRSRGSPAELVLNEGLTREILVRRLQDRFFPKSDWKNMYPADPSLSS